MDSKPVDVQTEDPKLNAGAGLAAAAAALDLEAAAVEAGPAAQGAPAPAAPTDWPTEAAELVNFCTTLVFPLWPRLEKVYDEKARARIAGAAAPLMEKYGFNMAELFGRWMPEISFAMVALPLIAPTIQAIKLDRAERKAAEAAAGKSTEAPGAAAGKGADPTNDLLARAADPAPAAAP